jgi:hypothetical protein
MLKLRLKITRFQLWNVFSTQYFWLKCISTYHQRESSQKFIFYSSTVERRPKQTIFLLIFRTMWRKNNWSSPFVHVLRESWMEGNWTEWLTIIRKELNCSNLSIGLSRPWNGNSSFEVRNCSEFVWVFTKILAFHSGGIKFSDLTSDESKLYSYLTSSSVP